MKALYAVLLALVLGGGSKEKVTPKAEPPKATPNKLITDPIVEKAIRWTLEKPEGVLTETDLEKVTKLDLDTTKITDAGLKEVAKLKQLTLLGLVRTKVTKAGVAELKKALPKCRIFSNPKK